MTASQIVPMTQQHWESVRKIYAQGIATGNATFEQTVPEWTEWDTRHLPSCRLVALLEAKVVGWAALNRVSTRRVYEGVAEVSIYIAEQAQGQGIGKQLLAALIARIRKERHLDVASGNPRRECDQHSTASEGGLPHCRHSRKNWLHGWMLARHRADGASEFDSGRVRVIQAVS